MHEKIIFDDYIVSDNGDVYSSKNGYKEKIKTYNTSRGGKYKVVRLVTNGKAKLFYVHRLVAENFIPNPRNLPQVNHIDGVSENNHWSNLEWCTNSQNMQHAYDIGLFKTYKCVKCGVERKGKRILCCDCRNKILDDWESDWRKMHKKQKLLDKCQNAKVTNERQKDIINLRSEGVSLEQIGEKYGISRQRVHQIIDGCLGGERGVVKGEYDTSRCIEGYANGLSS